jgi:hypothetical protein
MKKSSVLRSFCFYAAAGAGFFLLLKFLSNFGTSWVASYPLSEKFSKGQDKQLEILFALTQQLTTLATLTIGGVAAFVFQRYNNRPVPGAQVIRAMLSWVFSGLSLVFGWALYQRVVYMLGESFFDLRAPLISWISSSQFITFGLSLIVFADFVLQALKDAPTNTEK